VLSHFLSHTACLESSLSAGSEKVIGMTAILGYARVSTIGQDVDAQLAALDAAGVESGRVFTDKPSGSAKTTRPGLVAMLDYARAGDTVVVTAIDRLGRSVAEVTRTIAELGERRIILRALREGVDTATPTGRAVAAIMATLAELELELGRERRAASRESRRARRLPATSQPGDLAAAGAAPRSNSSAVRWKGSLRASTASMSRSSSSRGMNRGRRAGSLGRSECPSSGRPGTSDQPHWAVSRKNCASGLR
jgi:DNA invertase Pin-like site-specific DNA recombinase